MIPVTPQPSCLLTILRAKLLAGDGIELVYLQNDLRLLGDIGKLGPIRAAIGHFVRDDEMMLGINRHLHVVPHDFGPRPLVAIERLSGSVREIC